MEFSIFQIDAFTSSVFGGNPAAVCPLDAWLPDAVLQKIASENNLSETAFFIKQENGYQLRWFTPELEVNLCGHATLASAFVLFEILAYEHDHLVFHTKSGDLVVYRNGKAFTMDFPVLTAQRCKVPSEILNAFGQTPFEVWKAEDYMVVFETEKQIMDLKPNFNVLQTLDCRGVIATAKGDDCHFVSRFFAPRFGIDEDPVTGSAHCLLTPYWAKKLNVEKLKAKQISKRGGELECELKNDRILITGNAVKYLEGVIVI